MKKQVVVIGLGRFGFSLANSLSDMGNEVLALDTNERKIQSVSTKITHVVQADATDEAVLNELGVKNFDVAVVAIGSDIQSSVLVVVLLKSIGVPYIIARANNKSHGEILRKIGADKVVFPEDDEGNRLAHELRLGNVSDYLPVTRRYGIVSIEAKDGFIGHTLGDLGFGPKGGESIAALLIQRGNEVLISPSLSEGFKAGDKLIMAGSDDKLEAFLAKIAAPKTEQG